VFAVLCERRQLPQYLATRNSPVLISLSPVISMIASGSAVVCMFGSKRSETQALSSAIWSGALGRTSDPHPYQRNSQQAVCGDRSPIVDRKGGVEQA
jgi:hypothetical protein